MSASPAPRGKRKPPTSHAGSADPASAIPEGPAFPDGTVSLTAAAEQLGVHYMTVYRYIRLGRLPATRSGGRWWIEQSDLADLTPGTRTRPARLARAGTPSQPRRGSPGHHVYADRLRRQLILGDEAGAWGIIEAAMMSGAHAADIALRVLAPALRAIGAQWATGSLSIGQEHQATAVATRLVARLGPNFRRRGRSRGTVLLAGVAGDPHAIPLAITADILRSESFTVVDLGPNTPTASIIDLCRTLIHRDHKVAPELTWDDEPPTQALQAIGLSVSADRHLRAGQRCMRALRRLKFPVRPPTLYIGGPAIKSLAQARELGADDWAQDAAAFARKLSRFTTRQRPQRQRR